MNKVIYVDAFKIRSNLDIEFTLLHVHNVEAHRYAPKFYIPEGEIWIDKRFEDETDFLMKIEAAYDDPESTYDPRWYIERFCTPGPIPEYVVRKEILGELTVVSVDGAIVRKYIDPQFVEGGHHRVYDYIPEGHIWLDNKHDPVELPFILNHEINEHELMQKGYSYDDAHDHVIAIEKKERRAAGGRYPRDTGYIPHPLSDFVIAP